ncbi:MAG: hypothetical protein U1E69_06330 [Tabrizicola sp.]|uniref:hypothetical protein n=1 Tax=Tabrizicola sp. TaxID=2005166 RepID=UPI002AB916C4|nr:hypothetical protein [Tabrizicola sp.]MDZ4086406.1 hypothetical protein [Tabrizicola sp.]
MSRPLALILFLATIAFAVAPFITPPFTGYRPGQFPVEIVRPAIQPAGYAFAIWSVIYLWLILHAGYGLWKRKDDPAWVRVRPALTVALLLGTVWLAIAGASPIWATAVILVMAAAAITAFLQAPTEPDRWLLSAPLAIFAGWLTAASLVSTGVLLAGYGYAGNEEAAYDMLGVILILAPLIQSRRPRMPVYSLTIGWALIGVAVANWGAGTYVAGAALGIGAVVLAAAVWFWRRA